MTLWDADDKATEEGRGSSSPGTRRSGISEAKQKFLAAHQFGASVVEAARLAGVHPRTPYRWRDHDPEFAQAFREARDGLGGRAGVGGVQAGHQWQRPAADVPAEVVQA